MGQCLKICERNFCLKMVDFTAISVQIFLILMLDQLSQRRKMRFERMNLIKIYLSSMNFSLEVSALYSKINWKICERFILKQL